VRTAAWRTYLLVTLALTGIGALAGESGHAIVIEVVGWSAVGATYVGMRTWQPSHRAPWFLFMTSGSCLLLSGVVRAVHGAMTGETNPFPSPADIPFFLGYLALIAGVILLIRERRTAIDTEHLIDSLIVVAAVGLIGWEFVLSPYLSDVTVPPADKLINVGYFACTLGLVLVTTRLAVGPGARTPSYYLLAGAVAGVFITDLLATLESAGQYSGDFYLVLAPLPYALAGAGALHPSMARLTERPEPSEQPLSGARVAMLGVALLVAPILLIATSLADRGTSLIVLGAGSVVMSLLVLARFTVMIQGRERKTEQEKILREAGGRLVAATTRHEIYDATLDAMMGLAGDLPGVRASIAAADHDRLLQVVASAGDAAGDALGDDVAPWSVPPPLVARLQSPRTVVLAHQPPLDLPLDTVHVENAIAVTPIGDGARFGLLVLSAHIPVGDTIPRAMETLAHEAGLALESRELTERLHRDRSDRRFRSLVQNSQDLIFIMDEHGRILFSTPSVEEILGYPEELVAVLDPTTVIHPDDLAGATEVMRNALTGESSTHCEVRLLDATGTYRWFEAYARDLRDNPEIRGLVLNARHISDRKAAEARLARSEARFRALVQNSTDVVAVADDRGEFTYLSPSITPMLGYEPDELVGTRLLDLLASDELEMAHAFSTMIDEPFDRRHAEARVVAKDGARHVIEMTISDLRHDPVVRGIVLNARDISDRKALEHDLRHQAMHDDLTGLGNRSMFSLQVAKALDRVGSRSGSLAVLFIDLDDFKTINDSLGHAVGDELLKAVAQRLRTSLRSTDIATRLGGDEFVLLLEPADDETEVLKVAERILEVVRQPVVVGDRTITATASIGIAINHGRWMSAEVLLRNADMAMYLAKERGKARFELFEEQMHAEVSERLELKADLSNAVDLDQLLLYYQPIVDLERGQLEGVEALLRWAHPERGLLAPNIFIPLAEESGLIVSIGTWVLDRACRQLVDWSHNNGQGSNLSMTVNISVRQLEQPDFVDMVEATCRRRGVAPERLTLEITESTLMDDTELMARRLQELHEVGVRLAIDDFGTGYSSLGYVRRYPFDVLKIDRSFVAGIGHAHDDEVVRAILDLAKTIGVRTIAEGIESAQQLEFLTLLGCDAGQGFYFSKPVPAHEIERHFDEYPPRATPEHPTIVDDAIETA